MPGVVEPLRAAGADGLEVASKSVSVAMTPSASWLKPMNTDGIRDSRAASTRGSRSRTSMMRIPSHSADSVSLRMPSTPSSPLMTNSS